MLHAKIKNHANFFFNKMICPPVLPYSIALGTILVPSVEQVRKAFTYRKLSGTIISPAPFASGSTALPINVPGRRSCRPPMLTGSDLIATPGTSLVSYFVGSLTLSALDWAKQAHANLLRSGACPSASLEKLLTNRESDSMDAWWVRRNSVVDGRRGSLNIQRGELRAQVITQHKTCQRKMLCDV
jgi:hypothetical protein